MIGAFLAGTVLAGSPFSETVIAPRIKALGYGLFIPLFFAFTGMQMDFGAVLGGATIGAFGIGVPIYLILFLALLGAVLACKYFGALAGCGYAGGFKQAETRRIASSAICVGEDTLAIAGIGMLVAYAPGMPLVTKPMFSVLGLLIIVTSLITPFALKRAYKIADSPAMTPRGRSRQRGRGL